MADVTQPNEERGPGAQQPGPPGPLPPQGTPDPRYPGYASPPQPGYGTAQPQPPAYPAYPAPGQQPYAPPAGYGAYQPYPGYRYQYPPGRDLTLAEFSHRFLARFIDDLVAGAITVAAGFPLVIPYYSHYFHKFIVAAQAHTALPSPVGSLGSLALIGVIEAGIFFFYDWIQHALWGQTLGKRALGTIVVTADGRSKISGRTAAARAAVWALPSMLAFIYIGGIFSMIDQLWLLWDPRRQCLHDKAGRTVVVKKDSLAYGVPPAGYASAGGGVPYPGYPGQPG
jgi:uncharacterized RDD family membrane protein YckC